ncbi:GLPGLI family protein [Flavobacteriaceae bacterium F08102]|nr:GLPGLI family protein [Flavobacteriaceae bacterium F08102]
MISGKSLIMVLAMLIYSGSVVAQRFQGKITYRSLYENAELNEALKEPGISLERRNTLLNSVIMLKKANERTYFLTFDKVESIYKEEEVLSLDPEINRKMAFQDYYKNFQEGMYKQKFDAFSEKLIINDSLERFNWKLHNERKKIGKYVCYKATYTENVISDSKRIEKENGSFEIEIEYKDMTTIAWYAPEIPVSNGPNKYGGLPGLILEVDFGKGTKIIATEVLLNPAKPLKINPPKGGKVVSLKEYNNILGIID